MGFTAIIIISLQGTCFAHPEALAFRWRFSLVFMEAGWLILDDRFGIGEGGRGSATLKIPSHR